MSAATWEFWIDVGGTFTDCLARLPDGSIRRHKLLSSGVTKGHVGRGSTSLRIFDAARAGDPDGFWTGWELTIIQEGREVERTEIVGFDAITNCLHVRELPHSPAPGASYELSCRETAPVIAISAAGANVEERERALRAGFVEYVRKPFEPQQLISIVAEHLRRVHLRCGP